MRGPGAKCQSTNQRQQPAGGKGQLMARVTPSFYQVGQAPLVFQINSIVPSRCTKLGGFAYSALVNVPRLVFGLVSAGAGWLRFAPYNSLLFGAGACQCNLMVTHVSNLSHVCVCECVRFVCTVCVHLCPNKWFDCSCF